MDKKLPVNFFTQKMPDFSSEWSKFVIIWGQHPEMDSNGDGNVNQPEDYALLRERYLPADLISLANPPELTKITEATTLKKGISSLRIEVELVGTNITHVYATVIPPTYDPTTEIASWSELEFDEFDLGKISEGKYAATYANFTLAGNYAIIVNAENADGFADPVQTVITVASEEEKPVTKKGRNYRYYLICWIFILKVSVYCYAGRKFLI